MPGDAERTAGDVLDGRYRLVERLGAGGFGDVWRADELLPGGAPLRQVALKLLHTRALDNHDWAAEARIIASLRHPALVTVYAAGVLELERPTPFVAMELLEGESLVDYVRRGRAVAWRRVLAWAREAAAALDTIHRAGVVHLDLKPANLFLRASGEVKVLDFGIARRGRERVAGGPVSVGGDDLSTAAFMVAYDEDGPPSERAPSYTVVGTPGFMAPEIFEEGEPGPATDAYALAACIVELATGRLPQQIDTRPHEQASTRLQAWFAELQAATVRGLVRDLAADHPQLPGALAALLQRWLALDPLARGVEAGGLRRQLDEVWRCPDGWPQNPYRGLEPYGLADEGTLPARGPDALRLARELVDQPCLVLQGEAGAGLRSLAAAAVVPELARSFADGRDDWTLCIVELDDEPDAALRRALDPLVVPEGEAESELLVRLRAAAERCGIVVLLDELHRLADVPARRWGELDALARALAAGVPGLRLLGTLREDRAGAFVALELGEALRPVLRYVTAPQPALIHEIVDFPARALGRDIAGRPALVAELAAELAADGGRLPLVSLALRSWWERAAGAPSAAGFREDGGVVGPLARHADRVLASLSAWERDTADSLLLRMVSADGTPVEVGEPELASASEHPEELIAVLERLVDAHLVRHKAGRYRLSHPGLVDGWPHLRDRRLHDLERLAFLEDLREAARRWQESGEKREHTWSRAKLAELERRAAGVERELGPRERAFVAATRRAVRLGHGLRALLLASAVAAILGAVWLDGELERRAAEQQRRVEYAQTEAAIGHMVTRSRRTPDPYLRVALLTGAIRLGSDDPVLSLELLSAVTNLPHAHFLSLQKVPRATFPWDERWLIGGSGAHAAVLDIEPPGAEAFGPMLHRFRPHAQGMYDFVPLPFDSAFVTRGLDGELKVWRLREDGSIALAAVSPMRCLRGLSALVIAARAPVIACSTSEGLARWDLRRPRDVVMDAFQGRVLDVSPDGRWIVAARLRKVLLVQHPSGRRVELDAAEAPSLARFSPRDELVALVRPRTVELYALGEDPPTRVFEAESFVVDPVDGRFSEAGLDFAVCNYEGEGEWLYLRPGGRAEGDAPPPAGPRPCRARSEGWPRMLDRMQDYEVLSGARAVGPRIFEGGWRFEDGRYMTRDLVIFDPHRRGAGALVRLEAPGDGALEPGASVAAVARESETSIVWQVGRHLRMHEPSGKMILQREGQLLGRCPDGRVVAWRRAAADRWELFGARNDVLLGTAKRRPGFVLGLDPGCHRLLVQWLDGRLASLRIGAAEPRTPAEPQPLSPPGGDFVLEGYVYDVRPSPARASLLPGLWLALSGGALVRFAGPENVLRPYGHATPRATAMADGPLPGELVFADETGIVLRSMGARDRLILPAERDRSVEDLRVLPDGRTLLVSWAHGVAMVDMERGEVLGELDTPSRGRLAPWDAEGSVLVWPFSFEGDARGEVIPIGGTLIGAIEQAASNLRAKLGDGKQPLVELED